MPKILLSPNEILEIADKLEGISLSSLLRAYVDSIRTGGPGSIDPALLTNADAKINNQ